MITLKHILTVEAERVFPLSCVRFTVAVGLPTFQVTKYALLVGEKEVVYGTDRDALRAVAEVDLTTNVESSVYTSVQKFFDVPVLD